MQLVHFTGFENPKKTEAKASKKKKKYVVLDVPTESETDVPVAQVFHTLRSAAKAKGNQVIPSREKKAQPIRPSKKSVHVEMAFDSNEEEVQYNYTLLNDDAKEKWKPYQHRGLIIHR